MANCHEMRQGEIYVCGDCGLEIQVVKECKDLGKPADSCECHTPGEEGVLVCCGKGLQKRQ